MSLKKISASLAAIAFTLGTGIAHAASPEKPITIMVP